ncbi:uncharacterized protein IL334_003929 [Kwoniella shivajii]|uniref:Uncharacterized protein n=1 Tax=Kwoniella shivajii TaxID=564305 RepID=A0ABZ1D0S3_9TREE|nr:hypothetical protein IL334_003929 [Kwoniella shivajii]
MGNVRSRLFPDKHRLSLHAVHFKVYSFDDLSTYEKCFAYSETYSDLFDQINVSKLNANITYIACYRTNPYSKQDIEAIRDDIQAFLGPTYTVDHDQNLKSLES